MRIDFVRLTEVPPAAVLDLLNEPRNSRHMPLSGSFTEEAAAAWVSAKDGQWTTNGYGPWAVLLDREFAGWGGFQRDEDGADFALVLSPRHWGHGAAIARAAFDRGFTELGLDGILIALPHTRRPDRVASRLGFGPAGEVTYAGVPFHRYRLTRQAWAAAQPSHADSVMFGP